ncbi:HTH-type transcriptional regulator GltC [Roseovarius albus]|uniref:HTH-type transcriptional regulator GltC n=1 Tax=Roseovarius albus TaxID=1247867 RepID=A0A1X6ZUM0_9RHOB|nr:LysR family transcriptional regulator [Roseovarius albus]SLN62048.1 HTH-type transcriptional regulator GltC [Roseovarius albus]
MRLTYRQVEYLRELARHDSIAAACKVLAISQSSVLAAIDVAEDVTGTQLFTRRKGHGIALTPAGRTFLISAHRFLASGEEFSRALEQFSETSGATLRVGCFVPFGALLIPPVIKRFIEHYGDCEFILLEGDQTELRSWLAAGEVDLIVTYDIGQEFGSSTTPICKFPTHALVHADSDIATMLAVSLKRLAEHPLVLLDLPETRVYLLGLFDNVVNRPKIGLRTRSYETVRSAVSNGLGVSILNIKPTPETIPDNDNLARVPLLERLREPTLLVADPYGDQKPASVAAFISVLHQYITELGPNQFAVVKPEDAKSLMFPAP